MFRTAVARLTLWYLCILMALSACFSVILYRGSTGQLEDLRHRQDAFVRQNPVAGELPLYVNLNRQRLEQIEASERHIADSLLYFNLVILVVGGFASYSLARRTLQPIEEALEAQRRFTADASHELRTPLTAMRTEVEVALRDRQLDLPEAKRLLKSNLEEIGRLESLSNALLTLAKTEDDPAKRFAACSLGSLAEAARDRALPQAAAKGIDITTDIRDVTVQGDSWGLTELLVILLENAVKYSPKGSQVNLRVRPQGDEAVAEVEDRGRGIAPADLPRIFDRFWRADVSRTGSQGYGLGLSIAKAIIRLHRGEIAVESELGAGSTFTVTLPRRQKPGRRA